MVINEKLTSLL